MYYIFTQPWQPHAQDAQETMEDSCGRWFSFVLEPDSLILLERKPLPDHLSGLPCVNTPTPVNRVLRELEDAGEVGVQ